MKNKTIAFPEISDFDENDTFNSPVSVLQSAVESSNLPFSKGIRLVALSGPEAVETGLESNNWRLCFTIQEEGRHKVTNRQNTKSW